MDVACSDFSSHDAQRKGFHTFVMTGDAIIRTNFNPFKPTRQLSLDSPRPVARPEMEERSVSHVDRARTSAEEESDDEAPLSASPHACTQTKAFIPGFMRVEEGGASPSTTDINNHTADSGIDVQLSDEDTTLQSDGSTNQSHSTTNDRLDTEADNHSAVDEASAKRLATRLYQLDGFKLSDVCHYLSKSDNFTQKAVTEFLAFFDFTGHSLVDSLRAFLVQISLEGDIEEKEKVLLHFTKRFMECNRLQNISSTFHSEDSCHTLVCALTLLNTDLHNSSETSEEKISHKLFIENLALLNGGEDFPKQLLTSLYYDIKNQPLFIPGREDDLKRRLSETLNYGVEPLDTDPADLSSGKRWCYPAQASGELPPHSASQLTSSKLQTRDAEHMSGYLLKKHCKGPKGVKTASGKRGWRRHFAVLMDLKLMLFKSDKSTHNHQSAKSIDLDNAYASVATHYTKRKNAIAITTADSSEYLLVVGDRELMEDWIYSINLTAACYSKEFQHAHTPIPHLRLSSHLSSLGSTRRMREQLRHYEAQVKAVGNQLLLRQNDLPQKGATRRYVQEFTESKILEQHHLQKYTAYVGVLRSHLDRFKPRTGSVTESIVEEPMEEDNLYVAGCRMSYRLAIYGPYGD